MKECFDKNVSSNNYSLFAYLVRSSFFLFFHFSISLLLFVLATLDTKCHNFLKEILDQTNFG